MELRPGSAGRLRQRHGSLQRAHGGRSLAPPQVDKARALYQEALAALPSESLLAQETMLRLLSTYLQRPDRAEMRRGCGAECEECPHNLPPSLMWGFTSLDATINGEPST